MSWIIATVLLVAAGFIAAYVLCEWLIERRGPPGGDDTSATG